MGYQMNKEQANKVFETLCQTYEVFAPKVFEKDGCFTDIDTIRYDKVASLDEIEWTKKLVRPFSILQKNKQRYQRDLKRKF